MAFDYLDILPQAYYKHLQLKQVQTLVVFAVFVLQYAAEHIQPAMRSNNSLKLDLRNIAVGVVNTILLIIPAAWMVALISFAEVKHLGLFNNLNLPLFAEIVLVIFLLDFFMYWWHRFNHVLPLLWHFHRYHHVVEKMNTTTALRFHIIELAFSNIYRSLVYLLLGPSIIAVLFYEAIFFAAVIIHHSNIGITQKADEWYRKLFSSPVMHRIHHSRKKHETNSNYGSVFSFWDRLFGSYRFKAEGQLRFGIDE